MFLPIASTLVSHPPPGWWWLVLVGWAFVWPHLAWQIASRAVDPLSQENLQLKNRCSISGNVGDVMGVNVLPSTAMLMIMSEFDGGRRLSVCCGSGVDGGFLPCHLELTGITVSFNSAPLEWWLSFPLLSFILCCLAGSATRRRLNWRNINAGCTGHEYPRRYDGRV